MASFNYYLRDKKATGMTSIYLLFDDGVNRAKFYIQESINPKDWNPLTGEARKSLNAYSVFNAKLQKIQSAFREIHITLTKDGIFTIDALKERFASYLAKLNNRKVTLEKNYSTITEFGENFINSVNITADGKRIKSSNTRIHNLQTLRLLKEFERENRIKLTFERITLDFYHDFLEFLNKKNYSPNSISKHIKNIKLFLNEATEKGLNTKLDYKSKRFSATTSNEELETIYLTDNEIQAIYNCDFTDKPGHDRVRDLFIIGCYTGLRFSDFSTLNSNNISNNFIHITTQKTGDKVIIPIRAEVKSILLKYEGTLKGLPKAISNQKMNQYLKEIGKDAGINELMTLTRIKGGLRVVTNVQRHQLITTHTARRSFATNLYLSGFPAISIMKITGHKTEKAFMQYIRVSKEETAKLLENHWNANKELKIA